MGRNLGDGSLFKSKAATAATIEANQKVADHLNFDDVQDFGNADKLLLKKEERVRIASVADSRRPAWGLEKYKIYINEDNDGSDRSYPASINPSLLRNAQLCLKNGLYEVITADVDGIEFGIYQIRGYDLSNTTFVRGRTGWIIIDTLTCQETAAAAWRLLNTHFEPRPIKAVIYSHSHVDHFGGVRGFFDSDEDLAGVEIIAPGDFTEHAVSENVIAGNAMSRRAVYMYGSLLPRNEKGGVNSGLGMTVSAGKCTMVVPTMSVTENMVHEVDGVIMDFQCTPGTEAPCEMNTYFPQLKALWMAENTTNTMHNVLTLRGAKVRDSQKWASYINETIETYGADSVVKFQSHHWPLWGNADIIAYLKKQRDLYKFTHDQTVRLMNAGYIGSEISEMITLPDSLEMNWSTRGYYGTLKHNSRAVYQFYMGWYSGNPSDLDNLPPVEAAVEYVRYMGGAASIIAKAQEDFTKGNYRWVAEVLKHVVFATDGDESVAAENQTAKELLADAYEQMGYQAESGAWRAVYLQGALELRNGVPKDLIAVDTVAPDVLANMTVEMMFDYFAVQVLPEKATGEWCMHFLFTDLPLNERKYTLTLSNCVLNTLKGHSGTFDLKIELAKSTLNSLMSGSMTIEDAAELMELTGDESKLADLFNMVEKPEFWFNIVTP